MSHDHAAWSVDTTPKITAYLQNLSEIVQNEVFMNLEQTAQIFNDAGRGTHFCTNGLYQLKNYKDDDGKVLYMKYHIDNEERKIRLVGFELDARTN